MIEQLPQLNITTLPDGNIRLENQDCGDTYTVDIHPAHLRLIAEKTGLVREMSANFSDTLRTLRITERRMKLVHGRVDELGEFMTDFSDMGVVDRQHELQLIRLLRDLLDEFVADLAPCPLPTIEQGNASTVTSALVDGHVDGGASRNVTQLVTPMSRDLRDKPTQLEIAA